MKSKDKIVELLLYRLGSVYCNTCDYKENEEYCDECHRKSMNWSISETFANSIAEEICK